MGSTLINTVACRGGLQHGVLDWMIGYSHTSGLQAIQRYRYSTHIPVHRYTRTRILRLH
jgi:hypothetical protein